MACASILLVRCRGEGIPCPRSSSTDTRENLSSPSPHPYIDVRMVMMPQRGCRTLLGDLSGQCHSHLGLWVRHTASVRGPHGRRSAMLMRGSFHYPALRYLTSSSFSRPPFCSNSDSDRVHSRHPAFDVMPSFIKDPFSVASGDRQRS